MPRTDNVVEVVGRVRAMATEMTVRAVTDADRAQALQPVVDEALHVFRVVDAACTRFDPASPLMAANAAPTRWTTVPRTCFDALVEAHRAYADTAGRFDPRVLSDLVRLGYATSMAGGVPETVEAPHALDGRRPLRRWRPRFRPDSRQVRLGRHPVDLGGIGKGLAVRWSADRLRTVTADYLVEAGGDCVCAGAAPDGGPWRVGVEDPAGGPAPVAVLALRDRACATSSVRVRRWRVGDQVVHHLLDPRTGRPGGAGLQSVTVVHPDPATAEVWSKVLFLAGREGVAAEARRHGLAALWVDDTGRLGGSEPARPAVVWTAR